MLDVLVIWTFPMYYWKILNIFWVMMKFDIFDFFLSWDSHVEYVESVPGVWFTFDTYCISWLFCSFHLIFLCFESFIYIYRHRRWLFMLTARVCACTDFAITEVYQKQPITVKISAKWLENIFFTPRAFNILYWFLYFKLFKAKQIYLSLYVL